MVNGGRPRFFKVFLPFRHTKRLVTTIFSHSAYLVGFVGPNQGALQISQEKGKKRVREQAEPCLFGTTECAQQRRSAAVPEAVLGKGNGKDSDQLVCKSRLHAQCCLPMSRSDILIINQPSFASRMKKFNVQHSMLLKSCEAKITNMCTKVIVKKNISWLEITMADYRFTMMIRAVTQLSRYTALEHVFCSSQIAQSVQFVKEPMKLKSSSLFDPKRFPSSPRVFKSRRFPIFDGIGPAKSFESTLKNRSPEALAIEGGNEPEKLFNPR
ncbi:hypothetical protein RJ640_006079 [Escallonia rubra]|uniref:Uncharacterized protein n=1 Tax=Escallonia rubra TaxID=112253 RepID=A0AA88RWR5_9ASTE|nr:hypothetical protein RJ640_006079 [Escallonia rubra]